MQSEYRSPEYGTLQTLVNKLFADETHVSQIDLIVRAEALDLCEDLREVCARVPAGTYTRRRLCDQLNSTLVAHGWGSRYGTVE